ncbi:MAG TPA: AMP-binding protein [Acidimicrobiales bacterium]|nr:AMP-binding protein [Acidimicrobiales bacterium]
MRHREEVCSASSLRRWQDHLPAGVTLTGPDLTAGASLPAVWAEAWGSLARRPLLRVAGGPEATGWVTADEFEQRTRMFALRLAEFGLGEGDRVGLSLGRDVQSVVAWAGVLRAGGVTAVPLNPQLTEREVRHVVADASPAAAVVADAWTAGVLARAGVPLVLGPDLRVLHGEAGASRKGQVTIDQASGADAALVCYTSGTTGAPKGAVLSHANLLANSRALAVAWRWEPGDRLLHVLPLFHGHGLCAALYTSLLVGGSVVLMPGFDLSATLDAIGSHAATLFFGVPTMYHRLAASGRAGELAPLRLAVSGSAPLAAGLHRRIAAQGTVVLERYGMTETLLTVSNPSDGERRAGTVGFPLPGMEACIDPGSGQVLVRGPQVFGGYLRRPAQSAEVFADGWFCTGDLGEVDDGYLRLLGRAGDVVICGGFNVYPAEVEDVLLGHPAVTEVAVSGTPSEEWGEVVTAWVVPDASVPRPDDLIDDIERFAAVRLAPYKRPRLVRLVPSLPRNAMGKILRSELR